MAPNFPRFSPRRTRGVTTVELMVAMIALLVVMSAVYALVHISYQSYLNLLWQNKVNQEARQTLDEVCEFLRTSGPDDDLLNPKVAAKLQIEDGSNGNSVRFFYAEPLYEYVLSYQQQLENSISSLTRYDYDDHPFVVRTTTISQLVDTIQFEYEYRLPADTVKPTWGFTRIVQPTGDQLRLIKTIYITVTTHAPADLTGGQDYTRTLRSAVTLRRPYNLSVPPAQAISTN